MSTFLSIRNYVYFRHLFDAVHPFFWPVLYWQLKAAWISLQREKLTSVMLAVTWWGGVRIVYRGDRIETPKHDPPCPAQATLRRPHLVHPPPGLSGHRSNLQRTPLPQRGGLLGPAIALRSPRQGIRDSFDP